MMLHPGGLEVIYVISVVNSYKSRLSGSFLLFLGENDILKEKRRQKMLTIENSWKNIVPICGNHKERVEMVINNGPHSMFYSCPKYYPENRTKEERACNNRINLIEYQKMVDKLMGMIAEAEVNGETVDLTNFSWSSKGTEYKVLEHDGDKLYVQILNLRAMRR